MTEESDRSEAISSLRTTAMFANRFYVSVAGGLTRISFGEIVFPGETHFHTSVVISNEHAKILVDLIVRVMQRTKEISPATPPSSSPKPTGG